MKIRPTTFAAWLATTATLVTAPPALAGEGSLPQVSSGARPGPDVLYAEPPRAPQLENTGSWTAAPILVSGASAYRDGEFLYQDFLYDDRGARGANDPTDPFDSVEFSFSPKYGTLTYPTDDVFANNAADLVELRVQPLPEATAFRVTLNTLKDPERTAFTIALGSSPEPRAWPHGAGVSSPAALFLTVHGDSAELLDAAGGEPRTPAPSASVDLERRQIEVQVPHAAWNPGREKIRMAAGVGLWDVPAGRYLSPQAVASATAPGGAAPSDAALFNVAFRFDEPVPAIATPAVNTSVEGALLSGVDGTWWRERAQAEALGDGDVSRFSAEIDFGMLADGRADESGVPGTGPMDRIYPSRFVFGQGVDYDNDCGGLGGSEDECEPRFVGQLQTYGLYVPAKPRPPGGFGMTLLLHGLAANHNEFLGSRHASQFGERAAGSLVAFPYGRGPDGFYKDIAEADVFEVWSDVARHYDLDPAWAATSGYSMGGIGSYRLLERWPDLFARGAPIVGFAQGSLDQLASLRHVPVIAWNGGQDELVNPLFYEPTLERMGDLGLRFVSDVFEKAGHITLATNDEYGPMAEFLGEHRVERSPARVTYVVAPRTDSERAQVVADHAYWLSGLRLRDATADPSGTIDARSQAFGLGDPPVLGVKPGAGVLTGGSHGPLPFVRRSQSWGAAPEKPAVNALEVDLANIGRATVDGRRARLAGEQPLTVRVASDGEGSMRLDLPLPAGATVERIDEAATPAPGARSGRARSSGAGARAAAAAPEVSLDRDGATFTVAEGMRTYRIQPPAAATADRGGAGGETGRGGSGQGDPAGSRSGGTDEDDDGAGGREEGATAPGGGSGTGELPFTGLALGLLAVLGAALLGGGTALRRRARS